MFQEKAETASYIDNGLKGANGAAHVLQLLAPRINELVLSHNNLGDEGVRVLCEGLVKLRRQYNFPGILELNLSMEAPRDALFLKH